MTEVARHLRRPGVSAVVVLAGADVAGVVTASDVVALVAETDDRPSVDAVMSSPVRTVSPGATLPTAAERMRGAGVKHLAVVDDGTYAGLLSADALAPYCSRRNLDIEWRGEPLRVDGGEDGEVVVGD